MRKAILFTLLALFSAFAVNAQSGRRITPSKTPLPPVEDTESSKKADAVVGYSESRPTAKRNVTTSPTLRSAPAKSNNDKATTKTTEPEVLGDSDDDVVKVDTNLITIPVSVFDRSGLYVADLEKNNFKVFEDGVEQPVEYFSTSDTPVTVVLLIDTSPSTAFKIEEIQQAAISFVNLLKPADSVIVIEFDGNVHVLSERTTDREKIYKGIRRADFGGGTALYDAVEYSIRKKLAKVEGRKAIVLFTDGVDTQSGFSSYDRSLREAEEADATIFPIYYNTFLENQSRNGGGGGVMTPFPPIGTRPRGITSQEYSLGRLYLNDLADATGGRVFNAENTPGGLVRTFASIAEELSRQYTIGYVPEIAGQAGQRRAIKVRVNRPNLQIRARDSYVVGETATTK